MSDSKLHQSNKIHNFDKYLQFKIELNIPKINDDKDIILWASTLSIKNSWSNNSNVFELNLLNDFERIFIAFYLEVLRYLYELANIPVFDTPRITSLERDISVKNKYTLTANIFFVNHIPQDLHRTLIPKSRNLCQWMAKNNPTKDNIDKVFNIINEDLLPRLKKLVLMGKSTIPTLELAYKKDIPFEHLGLGIYRLGWGSKAKMLDRSSCELDSVMGSKLVQNKALTSSILRSAGLPSPIHFVVTTAKEALIASEKIQFPLVVKPIDLDRGEGVSIDISNEIELKNAFEKAKNLSRSKKVIIERQVLGVCHRFFIANNNLIYVVKRNPISVTGDGISTIKDLVDKEVYEQSKIPPWNRSAIKPIDELAKKTLAKMGFSQDSIPNSGLIIPIRPIQSSEWGGMPEDVTTHIHTENLTIALQAANLFKLHVAGIDIISSDISKPWYENDAIINEVNFAPLLGGGDISKSYIPKFFNNFFHDNGKIPIESFKTEAAAIAMQQAYIDKGIRCFFTTPTKTIDFSRNTLTLPFNDIQRRLRALIYRPDVDAITFYSPES
jgi:cyanophycin synthetase